MNQDDRHAGSVCRAIRPADLIVYFLPGGVIHTLQPAKTRWHSPKKHMTSPGNEILAIVPPGVIINPFFIGLNLNLRSKTSARFFSRCMPLWIDRS